MFTKPRNMLSEHIMKNSSIYLFLTMAFIVGVSAGAFMVNGLSDPQRDDLTNYFRGFMLLLRDQTPVSSELFAIALWDNLKIICVIWVLGITIIGIPFIFIILALKGFITGFSSGFIIGVLGIKGALFTSLALLPKEIFIVPCITVIGVNGINFSLRLAKSKSANDSPKFSFKSAFFSYCLVTALFSCTLAIGILIDAHITPIVIRIIAPVVTSK